MTALDAYLAEGTEEHRIAVRDAAIRLIHSTAHVRVMLQRIIECASR